MNQNEARKNLYNAIKDRGRLFMVTYRELSNRYGEAEATDIMRGIAYVFGKMIGEKLSCYAPNDFAGMAEAYAMSPDGGATFRPDIRRLDDTCLEVKMMACPIKDAWVEAGCSDEEICQLLHCARPQDEATFEAAGFDYEIEQWSPGKDGCCHSRLWAKS